LRRPFLPGDDKPWAESRRATLAAVLIRALDCRVDALASYGELKLALTHAQEAVRLEPYRESGYRRLMRLHVQNGDRAEAIRVYLECKRLLVSELGVAPSTETEALYRELAD
jgi:DNA-binding SARP family transcriptional activator